VGVGYDSHRLAEGGELVLGGICFPAGAHLIAHSDGDAVCHAITDAILGAAGLGDIGAMFPDTDSVNFGRDSTEMLGLAARRLRVEGWQVGNVDVVVVNEKFRVAVQRQAIQERLGLVLGIAPESISIKGKSNEGMGWTGRGEGIACIAVATLSRG
jgi:2-C-methyl-D-erythritol 2,4-cyclodiphosphate synthase